MLWPKRKTKQATLIAQFVTHFLAGQHMHEVLDPRAGLEIFQGRNVDGIDHFYGAIHLFGERRDGLKRISLQLEVSWRVHENNLPFFEAKHFGGVAQL